MKARLLFRRLAALFRTRRYDRELDDEVLAHLELAEREALAAGMSPEDARREARLRFGGIGVMKEEHRDRRSVRWLETLSRDVRYTFRSLMRDRTFTAVAIAVLTLAIGAGTAVFSVVDAVVLRGLPFEEHDRLVVVREYRPPWQQTPYNGITTTQTFLDWRREQRSFSAMAGVGEIRYRVRLADGPPAELVGQRVSYEFFDLLRVAPALGRTFSAEEETEGRHRVVVVSHGFWQRGFGGAPDVVGRSIEIDDQPWTIVGVLPRGFEYPVAASKPTEIYTPIRIRDVDRVRGDTRNYNFTVIGRLTPGVSIEQADADIAAITSRLADEFPVWFSERVTDVVPLHAHVVAGPRAWMLLLLGAVAVVLLIACANVANLVLARSTVRTRETTIRSALGASRWGLIRGVLIEGLLLAMTASALAVALAYGGVPAVAAWLPPDLPRVSSIAVDLRVLAAAILAALATGIAFSVGPALQSSTPDLNRALRDGGRSVVSRAGDRMRSALVVAEIAFAVFLVIGASLFVGSLVKWTRIELGFEHRNVMALRGVGLRINQRELADVTASGPEAVEDYRRTIAVRQEPYVKELMAVIATVPGVSDIAAASGGVPLTGSYTSGPVEIPERVIPRMSENHIGYRRVTSNYASLLGIPLRQGRYLTDVDVSASAKVAVVNESAARWLWPGESAIGRRLTAGYEEYTVVGVVGDIRHRGPEVPVQPEVHMPIPGDSWSGAELVLRTSRDPQSVLPDVLAAIRRVNSDQLLRNEVFTLEDYLSRQTAQRRFTMMMAAMLGAIGLVIAAAGVYGVMAYTVSQRRQEIGVRMALGARPVDVVSMILGRSAVLIAAGLVIGTTCAWYLSATVESFLFQLSPTDPYIYAAAIATLGVTGLVASIIPARRAAKVDPLIALRAE